MTLPAVTGLLHFEPPQFERAILSNGLELLMVRKPSLPIVDLQLIARGGASIDPVARAGRASLAAEMLDEGTLRHSALEISQLVEQLGADLDTRAGWDASLVSMHGLAPRFDAMLDLLGELATAPSFPEQDFRRKREERVHALAQERAEARTVAIKALARAIFGPDHPYGVPTSGTVATVAAMSNADVRTFYQDTFVPTQMHAVVVGDVDLDLMADAFERRFASLQPRTVAAHPEWAAIDGSPGLHLIDKPGAAQSEVRFGHPGTARANPDFFPLLLMNTILGGSFKSRLNMKLREEKGFTYGASTGFSFRRAGGAFGGGAAVFTDATAETVALSLAEITRMRDDGVSADELSRARNYLSLGFLRNFETTSDIASQLSEIALHDLPADYLQTYAERIASVSAADIARVAGQYLRPDQLSFVVVGDAARVRTPLQQLALGPVLEGESE